MAPLILTLELDPAAQEFFERMRRQHYPAHLNQIPAHLTLFHQLPEHALAFVKEAARQAPFALQVTGLRSLGRGVAYLVASETLLRLHAGLARELREDLIAQDRQKFSPHIVVQNKVTPDAAHKLLAELQRDFEPFEVQARGLRLWHYRNGPWEHAHSFSFDER